MKFDLMRLNQGKETVIYIVLWIFVLVGYMLHLSEEHSSRMESVIIWMEIVSAITGLMPLIIVFSINNYILIPKLVNTHKIWGYAISVVVILAIYGFMVFPSFSILHPHLPNSPGDLSGLTPGPPHSCVAAPHRPPTIPMPFIHAMFYTVLVIGVNLAISLLRRYIQLYIEKKNLEAANIQAQLDQLKDQINPHFYMNMLNSIHGLIDIDPEKAKELIMDMSRLMRYMLYDSSHDYILLQNELDFLKEYIRMLHERYPEDKVTISTKFPDNKEIENIKIPPLLFITFIENAFKYGIDYRHTSQIAIKIDICGKELHFSCMNFKYPDADKPCIKRGGIGLTNIRKRLALLYNGKETLHITETDEQYIVHFTVPFNEIKDSNN